MFDISIILFQIMHHIESFRNFSFFEYHPQIHIPTCWFQWFRKNHICLLLRCHKGLQYLDTYFETYENLLGYLVQQKEELWNTILFAQLINNIQSCKRFRSDKRKFDIHMLTFSMLTFSFYFAKFANFFYFGSP